MAEMLLGLQWAQRLWSSATYSSFLLFISLFVSLDVASRQSCFYSPRLQHESFRSDVLIWRWSNTAALKTSGRGLGDARNSHLTYYGEIACIMSEKITLNMQKV